jgi:hypothetical protein
MKIGAPVVSAMEMIHISKMPGVRISSTPFGIAGTRTWYIGASVPWKGVKGIENVRTINPRVAEGLSKAITLSTAHHEKGVALVRVTEKGKRAGAILLVPAKVAEMMREAGTGETIARYLSAYQVFAVPVAVPAIRPTATVSV